MAPSEIEKLQRIVARTRRKIRKIPPRLTIFANNSVYNDNVVNKEFATKLKYVQIHDNTSSSGTSPTNLWFRMNSLYDPDGSGIGHQPMGFDQLVTLYGRYRVNSVQITTTILNRADSAIIVNTLPFNGAIIGPNSVSSMGERSSKKNMFITSPAAGHNKAVRTEYIDLAKFHGVTKAAYKSGTRYSSDIGDNPAEGLNYMVSTQTNAVPGLTTFDFTVEIQMIFYCSFYEKRNMLSAS